MKFPVTPALKRSFWLQSAEPSLQASPALAGSHAADVVIVGGGFVGLWTALTLKEHEPDCRVMILEQDVCGGGASGRNGGFVMSWWPKIQSLTSFCSVEQASFLAHSAERAISELGEFCQRHQVEAAFRQKGWLWTATCAAHVDAWNGTLEACARLGAEPFARVSAREVARRTGSPVHLAGVLERSNATVQPAALVHGMRKVALEAGVEIYENTAVSEIQPGQPVRLLTAHGQVDARNVVLATNAWSSAIPELAKLFVPVGSSIVVTEPIAERLASLGWSGGEAITDSQLMVDYYRTTPDGRIAFGKGTGSLSYGSKMGPVFSEDPEGIDLTEADLRRTYPMLKDVAVTHRWSGPIDRTYDSLPVFNHLEGCPNIHYGIGWSGNGVGPSRIGGRILASLALGRQDQWSQCALVGRTCKAFPPEPVRFIGGSLVRRSVIRKERAELGGHRAKRLDVVMAGFAPAGLEDKS
ncbi:Glycine/D-amino acid oxidase [Pseudomonas sp. ok272]|uniref:NAD(P)/FAD-dependent oxidoreductase n=1 Tax=unclassified Pseudomonas TaxID=196821 RepID=UPI0008ADACD5|nr:MULTISPECIES: FAD-dependent oxidoreductase [unclassified Pseudomonas]SEN52501.1 Glycine/D-amino acid oxidase [Pseudomonas sp. ok272]SFN33185.1 Glycine/D-amino acid oxidase [Pseudomonas sp. ok602]